MFCSHGRLFKQALIQDRAVKRVYTVGPYYHCYAPGALYEQG